MDDLHGTLDSILAPQDAPAEAQPEPVASQGGDIIDAILNPNLRQTQLATERQNLAGTEEGTGMRVIRRAIPFASAVGNIIDDQEYKRSRDKFESGVADDEDVKRVAEYEHRQQQESQKGVGGKIADTLLGLPAIIGEAAATGGIGPAAGQGAAAFVGKKALQAQLMPSMVAAPASQRSVAQGGEIYSPENLAPAAVFGAAQNLIFGSLGKLSQGIANPAARLVAAGGIFAGEKGALDSLAMAVDQVLPKAYRQNGGYGTIGKIMEGKYGEALQETLADVMIGAVFAALHGGKKTADDIRQVAADSLNDSHQQGIPPDSGGQQAPPPPGGQQGGQQGGRRAPPSGSASERLRGSIRNMAFDILGLAPDATPEQVQAAYRQSLLKNHPDRGGNAEDFARTQWAFDTLSGRNARQRPAPPERPAERPAPQPQAPEPPAAAPERPQEPPAPTGGPEVTPQAPEPPRPPETRQAAPPAEPQPAGLVSVRQAINDAQGDSNAAFDGLRAKVKAHTDAGGTVSAWMDGKETQVTIGEDGSLRGPQGEPIGMLPLAMGSPGKKAGLEFKDAAKPVKTPVADVAAVESAAVPESPENTVTPVAEPVAEPAPEPVPEVKAKKPIKKPSAESRKALESLKAKFEAGDPVTMDDAYEAAGVTAKERYVLEQRLMGRSFKDIGSDPTVGVTKQRVEQIEKAARDKLGDAGSIKKIVHDAQVMDAAIDNAAKGATVDYKELHADPEMVRPRLRKKLQGREAALAELEDLTTKMMEESDAGQLTPEREAFYRDEATRLHEVAGRRNSRANRQPQEVRGEPAPAPEVRQETRPETPRQEAAATPPASALTKGERMRRGQAVPKRYEAMAREAGLDVETLHGMAKDFLAQDRSGNTDDASRNQLITDAYAALKNLGVTPLTIYANRTNDSAAIKGLDVVAEDLAKRHPSLFSESENPTDTLFHILLQGKTKNMTAEDAYAKALDRLHEREVERATEAARQSGFSAEAAEEALRSGESAGEDAAGDAAEGGGDVGEFDPADFIRPGSPGDAKSAAGSRERLTESHPLIDRLKKAAATAPGLKPEQRAEYAKVGEKLLGSLPKQALDRLDAGTKNIVFHPSTESIGAIVTSEARLSNRLSLEEKQKIAKLAESFRKGGTKPGGAYFDGSIHIDGDYDLGRDQGGKYGLGKTAGMLEVWSHEFFHGIDGPQHEYSQSPEWRAAWEKEIKNPGKVVGMFKASPLSDYGGKVPSEGFAEFGRLLYGSNVSLAQIQKEFPLASKFAQDRGLWPAKSPGRVKGVGSFGDVFTERVGGPVDHVDVMPMTGDSATDGIDFMQPGERESQIATTLHYVNDGVKRWSGQMFPTTHRLDRQAGETVARFAVAKTYAKMAAEYYADKVLGPKASKDADLIAGAVMTERRLRFIKQYYVRAANATTNPAEKNQLLELASNVTSIIGKDGSPLKDFADYNRVLESPRMQTILANWRDEFGPVMDENFRTAQGLDANDPINAPTQIPGQPFNLFPLQAGDDLPKTAAFTASGNLRNPKARKLKFAKQATGSAEAYNLSLRAIIENTLMHGYPLAAKAEMYRTLVEKGLARWTRPGQGSVFEDRAGRELPEVKPAPGTQAALSGQTSLYVHPDVYGEVRRALDVDEIGGFEKGVNTIAALPTIGALASSVEVAYHSANLAGAVFAPRMLDYGVVPAKLFKNVVAKVKGDPAFRKQLLDLAKMGAQKPPGLETGTLVDLANKVTKFVSGKELPEGAKKFDPTYYGGKFLHAVNDVVRVTASQAYDELAAGNHVAGTEAEKRDFINGLTGQYEKKAQPWIVKFFRDTGIGPFSTAGTTMVSRAIRFLFGDPGVKGKSWKSSAMMRGEVLGKILGVLGAAAAINYALWKRADGDDNTPFGAIKVGMTQDGKTIYIDTPTSVMRRGLRATGLLALIEGKRRGDTGGEITDKAAMDAAMAMMHPFMGPVVQLGWMAATGKDTMGHTVAPQVPTSDKGARKSGIETGSSQTWQNVKTAGKHFNPVVEAVVGDKTGKETPWYEKVAKMFGPLGPKFREPPKKQSQRR